VHPCNDRPISDLDIDVRNYNGLRRKDIATVGQLFPILQRGRAHLRPFIWNETHLSQIMRGLIEIGCLPDTLPEDLYFPSLEHRLRWLTNTQSHDGSWDGDVERTTAAVLSFVRAGYKGTDSTIVHKGITWLRNNRYLAQDTIQYALERTIAEHDEAPLPTPAFYILC
jgi:hypothetical protein